jgi:hypothetical protein
LAQFLIALGTSKIAVVLPTINEHFCITQTIYNGFIMHV